MSRAARLVIVAANGARLEVDGRLAEIDLTGIPNADARAPLSVRVELMCDLGEWHVAGDRALPLYPYEHDAPTH